MATKDKGELREVSVVLSMEPDPVATERARIWWEQLIGKGNFIYPRGQKPQPHLVDEEAVIKELRGMGVKAARDPGTPRAPRAPRVGGESNADKVRAKIGEAKQQGKDQSWVQAWAVQALGMKEALAKTYVKNNWDKV